MVTLQTVATMAMSLPEVTEGERFGQRTWSVKGKSFAWERPFSKADLKRFGDQTPPEGPILALAVADLIEKDAVLAAHPEVFFTIPHFNGYRAFLVQLPLVKKGDLTDALHDAWLAVAPRKLADEHAASLVRKRRPR